MGGRPSSPRQVATLSRSIGNGTIGPRHLPRLTLSLRLAMRPPNPLNLQGNINTCARKDSTKPNANTKKRHKNLLHKLDTQTSAYATPGPAVIISNSITPKARKSHSMTSLGVQLTSTDSTSQFGLYSSTHEATEEPPSPPTRIFNPPSQPARAAREGLD
jgi:hypothetical protein